MGRRRKKKKAGKKLRKKFRKLKKKLKKTKSKHRKQKRKRKKRRRKKKKRKRKRRRRKKRRKRKRRRGKRRRRRKGRRRGRKRRKRRRRQRRLRVKQVRRNGAKSHQNVHCYKLANFVKLTSGNLKALQKVVRIIHTRSMAINVVKGGWPRKSYSDVKSSGRRRMYSCFSILVKYAV